MQNYNLYFSTAFRFFLSYYVDIVSTIILIVHTCIGG